MKIGIQSIHFDADQKLLAFIQKKVNKLDQFFDEIIGGEVYLKLNNVTEDNNKIVEIKVMIPGSTLFAKEECKSFEEATDLTIEGLRKQIKKRKDKIKSHESKHKHIFENQIVN